MSIQLALDGHSFSSTGLNPEPVGAAGAGGSLGHAGGAGGDRRAAGGVDGATAEGGGTLTDADASRDTGRLVEVEWIVPKTMLVPGELFDAERAGKLLAANGMAPDTEERVVYSAPCGEVVALMAVPGRALEQVRAQFGERTVFTTPLLQETEVRQPTVWICRRGSVLYIKVYGPALQLAEAIPCGSDADVLYLMERLVAEFSPAEYALHLAGDNPRGLRKMTGKRFKTTVCE